MWFTRRSQNLPPENLGKIVRAIAEQGGPVTINQIVSHALGITRANEEWTTRQINTMVLSDPPMCHAFNNPLPDGGYCIAQDSVDGYFWIRLDPNFNPIAVAGLRRGKKSWEQLPVDDEFRRRTIEELRFWADFANDL